jgi:hypothetical protein
MTASSDGTWSMGSLGINKGTITGGVSYRIAGQATHAGQTVTILDLDGYGIPILPDGSPYRHGYVSLDGRNWSVLEESPLVISPADIRFTEVFASAQAVIASGENYEIIFTGRDRDTMRFQYREYTSEDLARAAFSQDLSYPARTGTIRFRDLVLEIIELGDDSITYRVVARGAADSPAD